MFVRFKYQRVDSRMEFVTSGHRPPPFRMMKLKGGRKVASTMPCVCGRLLNSVRPDAE